uniref:Uncharacterized protein n=1 Tax=Rhizophora mucronata TaxID=61149 RepID=A0A2P2NW04_RHIMU
MSQIILKSSSLGQDIYVYGKTAF